MTRTIKTFSEVYGLLNRGKFASAVDEKLREAIETLEALPSEKGQAALTITVKLDYQNGLLNFRPDVKTKLPEAKGFTDTPFWTADGELSVEHPSQKNFGFETAEERQSRSA